jgi:hypothetical protein
MFIMKAHVMRLPLLLVALLAVSGWAYDQHNDIDYIMHYYEEQSQFPIVHTYYNGHFSRARQFEDFLAVLEEAEYRNKDYARFLLTDCDTLKGTPAPTKAPPRCATRCARPRTTT